MASRFILGAVSGLAMAAGFGTLASVLAPAPKQASAPDLSKAGPSISAPVLVAIEQSPVLPAAESGPPASPSLVLGATPNVDSLAALDGGALQPGDAPQTALTSDLVIPDALIAPPQQGDVRTDVVDSAGQLLQTETLVVAVEAEPAFTRAAPSPLPPEAENGPRLALNDEGISDVVARAALSVLPQVQPVQPEVTLEAEPAVVVQEVETVPPRADPIPPRAIAQTPTPPQDTPVEPEPVVVAQALPAQVERTEETQAQTPEAPAPDAMEAPTVTAIAPTLRPQIGKPAVSLTQRNSTVVVNRLSNTTPEAEPAVVSTEQNGTETDENARPVERYARSFENPESKPLMSIVLIDSGARAIGEGTDIAELRDFPYPLSFAVDSALADAPERIAMYRNEGFEVLSMIDMPAGALPSDAETALAVILPQMGEILGILEGPGIGLQETRELSDQVTAILGQSGHGLVAQAKGLNTMPNLARKVGVPAAAVFRDFDGKGQGSRVIRRFLDQAAFKAGQEGAVIMLGRLQPETISTLLLWGLQDRAGQVALAPISAVLLRDQN